MKQPKSRSQRVDSVVNPSEQDCSRVLRSVRGTYGSGLLFVVGVLLTACGGAEPAMGKTAKSGHMAGFSGSATGVDDARCDVEGRQDRATVVSRGLAAQHGSIQRVFTTGANKEDGKRVVRCREVDTNLDGIKDLVRTYTDAGEPLMEYADTNYDGQVDTWITFARGVVARLERDHNGDGTPDEFKVYSHGVLAKVQRDSDFDGKLDTWEIYDRGRLNRVGVDTNGDENVDRWYRDPGLVERAETAAEEQQTGGHSESNAAVPAGSAALQEQGRGP